MVIGAVTLRLYHPSPRHLLSPWLLQWKRRVQGEHPISSEVKDASWQSHFNTDWWGSLQASVRERKGECPLQCVPTGGSILVEIPASSSAHLQSWTSTPIWPGSSVGNSAQFRFLASGLSWTQGTFHSISKHESNQQPGTTAVHCLLRQHLLHHHYSWCIRSGIQQAPYVRMRSILTVLVSPVCS